jgi:predicted SprT family Zn-dependent metalloprotease|tara:strand:- start:521 stop:667 length:147 start_codon:yes stop_codon:yes gene_type:complete
MNQADEEKPKYWFFCKKCGDDYYTYDEEHAKSMMGSRWRCNACVYSWL